MDTLYYLIQSRICSFLFWLYLEIRANTHFRSDFKFEQNVQSGCKILDFISELL